MDSIIDSVKKWFWNPIKYKYTDFEGRATREEFWMFILVYIIIYIVLSIVFSLLALEVLIFLFSLAVLVPSIAITARRLHDTGKSGWWQLIGLVPVIGWLIVIILLVGKGTESENKYGPRPKEGGTEPLTTVVPEKPDQQT